MTGRAIDSFATRIAVTSYLSDNYKTFCLVTCQNDLLFTDLLKFTGLRVLFKLINPNTAEPKPSNTPGAACMQA